MADPYDNFYTWNRQLPPESEPPVQPVSIFYNIDDNIFLARVENMAVHKYIPDLVDTFVIQSNRALQQKKTNRVDSHYIYTDPTSLLRQIQSDISGVVIIQQNTNHKARLKRPGIGKGYQKDLFGEQ